MTHLNIIWYLNVILSDNKVVDAINNIHPLDNIYTYYSYDFNNNMKMY